MHNRLVANRWTHIASTVFSQKVELKNGLAVLGSPLTGTNDPDVRRSNMFERDYLLPSVLSTSGRMVPCRITSATAIHHF